MNWVGIGLRGAQQQHGNKLGSLCMTSSFSGVLQAGGGRGGGGRGGGGGGGGGAGGRARNARARDGRFQIPVMLRRSDDSSSVVIAVGGQRRVLTVEVSKAVLFRLQLNWLYMNRN
jgi:hypothetical protein